ncbi:hypothetical protein MMC26_003921 [Xylographa opegraphella]|nr:hypothetical protein [Xylographa opegraphella]
MVQIDRVRSCNSTLVKTQPLVAVFVGGTSGIGENTIRALAAAHSDQGKGLRLYIVGRNAEAAKKIIAECVHVCPRGQFRFVQAGDLALLKDVDHVCSDITRMEEEENAKGGHGRVDLLVMSHHYFPLLFQPRTGILFSFIVSFTVPPLADSFKFDHLLMCKTETKEGLDMSMSLLYYSRMRFVMKLLPLLRASPLPAHIVSVYSAGKEAKLLSEDLSLRTPQHYGQANVRSHVTYMTTLFMEKLAEQNPGHLSLVHVYPGLVFTEAFSSAGLPTWFKFAFRLSAPFVRPSSVSPEENGQRILFLATPRYPARQAIKDEMAADSEKANANNGSAEIAVGTDGNCGSGAYACNSDGETIPLKETYKKLREEGLAGKVWDHTMKAFDEIEAGGVFSG